MTTVESRSSVEYNPFALETQYNPFPIYQYLRNEAPVYHNEEHDFYAVSRYDDVLAFHLDPDTFISSRGVTIDGGEVGQPLLIIKDPPEHTWHRRLVSRVFSPAKVAKLEPFIRSVARELLEQYRDVGRFDIVEDFSIQMPLRVISEILDIPQAERQRVHHLADRLVARDEEGAMTGEAQLAGAELAELMRGLVVERRAHPGDDVISGLLDAELTDHEITRKLTDDELAFRFLELAFAGHETAARLIANGVVALTWYPDQRRELVADPSLLPNAVEEMLRWDPPSHFQGRWSTKDTVLRGVTIPKDHRVLLVTGAAIHDERVFSEPELFDIRREIKRPLSFGYGVHLCLGSALARLEVRVAFEELLACYPEWAIDGSGVTRFRSGNVRGLATLPIVFDT